MTPSVMLSIGLIRLPFLLLVLTSSAAAMDDKAVAAEAGDTLPQVKSHAPAPSADLPIHLALLRWESLGDERMAAGDVAGAADAYVNAAGHCFYEDLRGGFKILSIKEASSADEAPEEAAIRARLLKGYLLLARSATAEGTALLSDAADGIRALPDDAPFRDRYQADAQFLLSLAYLDLKDWTTAVSHARDVLRFAQKGNSGPMAFCLMVAALRPGAAGRASTESGGRQVEPYVQLFGNAVTHYAAGRYDFAREWLERIFRLQPVPEWNVLLHAANAADHSLVLESSFSITDALLDSCLEWFKRRLPEPYEEYAPVLVARACFLAQENDLAMEKLALCGNDGNDAVVAQRYLLEGRISLCSGKLNEARRAFADVLRNIEPADAAGAEALLHLGYLQLLQGDAVGGRQTLRCLLERFPSAPASQHVEMMVGDFEKKRPPPGVAGEAYNVLLVSLDTVRADHLSCYGYGRNTSPVLDALAGQGVLFEDMTAASSWTIPSHTSMFTSLYPARHGVEKVSQSLDPEIPTLARVLRDQGYSTTAFITGPAMNHGFGFNHGFDFYDDFTVRMMLDLDESHLRLETNINRVPTSDIVARLASAWLETHANDRFFLFVHLWDAHHDYIPPPPYDRMFDTGYKGAANGRDILIREPEIAAMGAGPELDHLVSLYDGEIARVDACLGIILDALESSGMSDRTLVIIVSDHGEAFLEHGHLRHAQSLHQEEIRVPLIMRLPKVIPAGCRVSGNASHVDIMPTILGLLGLPAPDGLDGADLAEVCRGNSPAPERPVYSRLNNNKWSRAVRWGRYKLIEDGNRSLGPLLVVNAGKEYPALENGVDRDTAAEIAQEMSSLLPGEAVAGAMASEQAGDAVEKRQEMLRGLGYME